MDSIKNKPLQKSMKINMKHSENKNIRHLSHGRKMWTLKSSLRGFHKSFPGPVRSVKLYDSNSSFYSPYGPRERFVKAPLDSDIPYAEL